MLACGHRNRLLRRPRPRFWFCSSFFESILRTAVVEVFVPKGLDDGSQAVYCLGTRQQQIRPAGYGVID